MDVKNTISRERRAGCGIKGHELILIQIGGNRFQTSSILNRICNFLGKGGFVEAAAIGANLSLRLMFEYFHFDGRQEYAQ